jgi:hypothetical protein
MSDVKLADADRDGAATYAKYPYFKAVALLKQAKLKDGHGEFEVAWDYAARAGVLADEARQTSKARRDLELRRVRGKVLKHKLGRKVLERIQRDQLKEKERKRAEAAAKKKRLEDAKPKPAARPGLKIKKTVKKAPVKKVKKRDGPRPKIKRRIFRPPIMDKPGRERE